MSIRNYIREVKESFSTRDRLNKRIASRQDMQKLESAKEQLAKLKAQTGLKRELKEIDDAVKYEKRALRNLKYAPIVNGAKKFTDIVKTVGKNMDGNQKTKKKLKLV